MLHQRRLTSTCTAQRVVQIFLRHRNHVSSKKEALRELARQRQTSRWEPYSCIADYHNGMYDCEHVSPYTKAAGNVDAQVMVLLQDWASHEWLSAPFRPDAAELGHDPSLPTNKNLKELLRAHLDLELTQTYATNLFPFVKPGDMQGSIRPSHLAAAASEFALPQLSLVAPDVVICLGLSTFNALATVLACQRAKTLEDAIANPMKICGMELWCQAHTGNRGQNSRNFRSPGQIARDWNAMAATRRTET